MALLAVSVASFMAWQGRSPPPDAAVELAAEVPAPAIVDPPAIQAGRSASAPIRESSVEQILQARAQGEWLVHRLQGAPSILVIEFPDLQSQGLALNRAAALFEKSGGRRHQVMNDAELGDLLRASGDTVSTFYLGHDYKSVDLASFFTMANAQSVALNAQERRLLQLLLDANVLRDDGGDQYASVGVGALVTFSAVQNAAAPDDGTHIDQIRRSSILRHELGHGRYFTDPAYRRHCEFFWRELLSESERKVWRRYLGDQGYNAANEDLMINEMQALLMHTTDERDFSAATLRWKDADLEGLRQRFRLGWAG